MVVRHQRAFSFKKKKMNQEPPLCLLKKQSPGSAATITRCDMVWYRPKRTRERYVSVDSMIPAPNPFLVDPQVLDQAVPNFLAHKILTHLIVQRSGSSIIVFLFNFTYQHFFTVVLYNSDPGAPARRYCTNFTIRSGRGKRGFHVFLNRIY